MEKDLADFAIEYLQKLGASYVEARLDEYSGNSFVMKNGIPQISSFDNVSGLGVRFIINKTLGFLSTNELQKEKIKSIIEKSIKTTKSASKLNEKISFSSEPIYKENYEVKQKINILDLSPEEKLKILFEAHKLLKESKIKIPGSFFSLGDNITTEYIATSEGTRITATIPRVDFMYYITIQENNKTSQRYWDYGASGGFEFVNSWNIPQLLLNEAKACQNNLKKGKKCPKGNIDFVVAPQVTAIMVHESVGHPYEADRILGREAAQAGESFVTNKMLNTTIGSKIVNVVDDPTIENGYGFYKYDNEGVKARRKYLMKNGIINEFLHNRQTAAEMGTNSNGSSRAVDYDKEPIVRMSNTILLNGDYKEQELFEDVKLGIYVKNFMEWNIDDKRFNQKYVGAESFLIKNGKIQYPIVNPVIEITTPKLWSSIDAIANNTEYHAGNCGKGEPMQAIPVWFGGPSMRLRNIKVL
ncbi:MAG: TldD/PmbA family protein [Candidatus Woesearchaeota archaeon]|nr:TldD/PmbA family protein [Candidatus Woesearchaeota archaeon]